MRQNKILVPRSNSIGTGKALDPKVPSGRIEITRCRLVADFPDVERGFPTNDFAVAKFQEFDAAALHFLSAVNIRPVAGPGIAHLLSGDEKQNLLQRIVFL